MTIRSFFKDLSEAISPPPKELGERLLRELRQDWRGPKYSLPRVRKFLEDGADVTLCDESGSTALTSAAAMGNAEIVAMILKKNPPIEARDNKVGWTPLITAAVNGYPQVLQMLIDKGADDDGRDFKGMSALDHAAKEEKPEYANCVRILQGALEKRREEARLKEVAQQNYEAFLKNGMPVAASVKMLKPLRIITPAANRNR